MPHPVAWRSVWPRVAFRYSQRILEVAFELLGEAAATPRDGRGWRAAATIGRGWFLVCSHPFCIFYFYFFKTNIFILYIYIFLL
jgi:hypothetical protein